MEAEVSPQGVAKQGDETKRLEGGEVHLAVLAQVVFVLAASRPTTTVVFRFDDYSATSDTTFEVRIIDAFASRGFPLTIGVIPYVQATGLSDGVSLTSEKAAILSQNERTVDVAVHGFGHRRTGEWTEFAGLDPTEQVKRLTRGKQLLEALLGKEITAFIPPWNAYDLNTLTAMRSAGFTCLSAGKDGPVGNDPMRFLPSTCEITDLQKAVQKARCNKGGGVIIVVLLHSFDFTEVNPHLGTTTFKEFEDLLDWVSVQSDVAVRSIGNLLRDGTDLSRKRYAANKRASESPIPLPSNVTHLFGLSDYVYLPADVAAASLRRGCQYAAGVLFYGLLGLGAALISAAIMRVSQRWRLLAFIARLPHVGIVILTGVALYTCRDLRIGYLGIATMSAAIGSSLGVSAERLLLWWTSK